MPTLYAIRALTIADYRRMQETGILHASERIELVEGRLLLMAPLSGTHAAIVQRLHDLLIHHASVLPAVVVSTPLVLSDTSQVAPDLCVVAPPPTTAPLLVVEVSDPASLVYDRVVKIPLYAAAAIPEVWIIDVAEATIEQYHTPVQGAYATCQLWHPGEGVPSLLGLDVAVDDVV